MWATVSEFTAVNVSLVILEKVDTGVKDGEEVALGDPVADADVRGDRVSVAMAVQLAETEEVLLEVPEREAVAVAELERDDCPVNVPPLAVGTAEVVSDAIEERVAETTWVTERVRWDDDVPEFMAVSEKEGEMVCVTVEVPDGIAEAVASVLAELDAVTALDPVALTVLVLT